MGGQPSALRPRVGLVGVEPRPREHRRGAGQRRPAREGPGPLGALAQRRRPGRPPPELERVPDVDRVGPDLPALHPRDRDRQPHLLSGAEATGPPRQPQRAAPLRRGDQAHSPARDEAVRHRQPLHAAQVDPPPDRGARGARGQGPRRAAARTSSGRGGSTATPSTSSASTPPTSPGSSAARWTTGPRSTSRWWWPPTATPTCPGCSAATSRPARSASPAPSARC